MSLSLAPFIVIWKHDKTKVDVRVLVFLFAYLELRFPFFVPRSLLKTEAVRRAKIDIFCFIFSLRKRI